MMTLPLTTPDEAMSNRLADYLDSVAAAFQKSDYRKLEPLASRIVALSVSSLFASMDCFYHLTGVVVKTLVVCARGTVQVLSRGQYGHFYPKMKASEIQTHLYKAAFFFQSAFSSPAIALKSPKIVVETYRAQGMIKPPKSWHEKLKDKAKDKYEETKARAHAFYLDHKKKIMFGLAVATVGVGFVLYRNAPSRGKVEYVIQRQLAKWRGEPLNSPAEPPPYKG